MTAAHSWHSPASIESIYLLFVKNEANYLWFYCPLSQALSFLCPVHVPSLLFLPLFLFLFLLMGAGLYIEGIQHILEWQVWQQQGCWAPGDGLFFVVVVVLIPNFSCCCVFFSKELVKVHRNLVQEIHDSIVNKNDQNLYQVFINYKER